MAEAMDESLLSDLNIDEFQVTRLQALFRGALVRKWLFGLKREFEDLVIEIDQSRQMEVDWIWPRLCMPRVRKQRKVRVKQNSDDTKMKSEEKSSFQKGPTTSIDGDRLSNESVVSADNSEGYLGNQAVTVETQTESTEKDLLEFDAQVRNTEKIRSRNRTEEFLTGVSLQQPNLDTQLEDAEEEEEEEDVISRKSAASNKLNTHGLTNRISPSELEQQQKGTELFHNNETKTSDGVLPTSMGYAVSAENNAWFTSEESSAENKVQEYEEEMNGRTVHLGANISSLTDVTSVWDSYSIQAAPSQKNALPTSSEALLELRKNTAMELLWVQQAITSRKNYLRLKTQMKT